MQESGIRSAKDLAGTFVSDPVNMQGPGEYRASSVIPAAWLLLANDMTPSAGRSEQGKPGKNKKQQGKPANKDSAQGKKQKKNKKGKN